MTKDFSKYVNGDTLNCNGIDLSRNDILEVTKLSVFLENHPEIKNIILSNCNLFFAIGL